MGLGFVALMPGRISDTCNKYFLQQHTQPYSRASHFFSSAVVGAAQFSFTLVL